MRARLKTVVVRRNIKATLRGYQQKRPGLPGDQGAKPERAARLTNMAKKLWLTRLGNIPCRSGRFGGVSGSYLSRTASPILSRGSGLLRMRFATMGAPWL